MQEPFVSDHDHLREQESLRQLIEDISQELELRPLLSKIVRYACELLHADRGTIGLLDKERNLVRTEAAYNMPQGEIGAEMPQGIGLAGKVLETKKALCLQQYADVDEPTQMSLSEDTVIGMPIHWRDEMIGFFGIGANPPRHFNKNDLRILELFSRHAAIAINNAQLFAIANRRAARMETISTIGQLITRRLSLDEVLNTALKALNDHLNYEHIALLTTSKEDPNTLELKVRSGVYATEVADGYTQSIHKGIIGAAVKAAKPLLINNVKKDPRYLPIPGGEAILSELAIPLRNDKETLGVLNIESEQRFSPEDVKGLSIVASQLAIAIDNASRFAQEKRRTARITTVSRIGQLMTSSLSLNDILQTAVEAINTSLEFSSTGIFLVSPNEPERLILQARSGPGNAVKIGEYFQRLGEGNVGLAAQTRNSIFVKDSQQDEHYITFPGAHSLRSELALPIIVGKGLLGVLNVESETLISTDDAQGLEIVADQLGVAIDNAGLFAKTESALSEMHLLYETSQRITMAMDLDGVIAAYLNQVATRRRYRCSIAYFESEEGKRNTIHLLGRWVPQQGVALERFSVPYFEDAFDPLLDTGQTVTISDVANDPRASTRLKTAQLEAGYLALALIPLIARGQRIGVIALSLKNTHLWSETDLRPYQVTAAQLATAISNRLQQEQLLEGEQQLAIYEERQRLARELHDSVTQVIFSISLIAQSIRPLIKQNPQESEKRIEKLLTLSQKARAEMRALIAELRPSSKVSISMLPDSLRVREYGLIKALDSLLEDYKDDQQTLRFSGQGYQRRSFDVEQMFYRITQEALTNIKKHAEADQVTIELWDDDLASHLHIEDTGKGFDHEVKERAGKHLGLNTMRERAESLGGSFTLESYKGKGTHIHVSIPKNL